MNICAVEIEREVEKISRISRGPRDKNEEVDESFDLARRHFENNWISLQHTDATVSHMV